MRIRVSVICQRRCEPYTSWTTWTQGQPSFAIKPIGKRIGGFLQGRIALDGT